MYKSTLIFIMYVQWKIGYWSHFDPLQIITWSCSHKLLLNFPNLEIFINKLHISSYLLSSSFRAKFVKLSLLVLNERKNLPYPDGESWSGHIWSNVLGLFFSFYLVGLHYPPHFDFGCSKKNRSDSQLTDYITSYQIFCLDLTLTRNNNYIEN